MKRSSNTKSKASALFSAGVMLSAGAQAMAQGAAKAAPPKPAAPAGVSSNSAVSFKFAGTFQKFWAKLSLVGTLDGRPVFKTDKGEYFHVDPNTGDLKFHSAESLGYIKITSNDKLAAVKTNPGNNFVKYAVIKLQSNLSLLGVDAQGHVVQQNSRGEKFYLGANGDMVFVK